MFIRGCPGLFVSGAFSFASSLDTGVNNSFLTLVSQATFSGVSVAEIRQHLNISDTSTDTYIQTLIDAARVYAERYTMMDLTSSTWTLTLEGFPSMAAASWYDRYGNVASQWPLTSSYPIGRSSQVWQRIDLKRGPVSSVTSVQYYDGSNNLVTYDSSNYALMKPSYHPGYLEPLSYWPSAYARPDAVTITFVTGFASIPAQVKHAIRLLVGLWWSAREDLAYGPGTVGNAVGGAVDVLLGQIRTAVYS